MLQQQLLCLIYTVYYKLYSLGITGDSMLTHDQRVCCSGTYDILQNDQPPLFQQYFIEHFVYLF